MKHCNFCNKKYFSKWKTQIYCSSACNSKSHRLRNLSSTQLREKTWRNENAERVRENRIKWRLLNKERQVELRKIWLEKNRDLFNELHRLSEIRRRAKKALVKNDLTNAEWEEVKKQFNYICLSCHKNESQAKLTIDHIMPISKYGENTKNNIQPLCHSCNAKKGTQIIDYRREIL